MRSKKALAAISVCVCSAFLLTGCSLSESLQKIVSVISGNEMTAGENVQASSAGTEVEAIIVDESIQEPVFDSEDISLYSVRIGAELTLSTNATVTDGGTVTYQWYSNNVSSNGGGTIVKGATSATYQVPTDEKGSVYYFVVATNTVNGKVNMSTGPIIEVTCWEEGIWQRNADNGGCQYVVQEDGSYPVSTTMVIDGVSYTFDENGYAIDENGAYIDVVGILNPDQAYVSAEEAPVEEEAPAEEATDGEEGTEGEEAPAEEGTDGEAEEIAAEEIPAESVE